MPGRQGVSRFSCIDSEVALGLLSATGVHRYDNRLRCFAAMQRSVDKPRREHTSPSKKWYSTCLHFLEIFLKSTLSRLFYMDCQWSFWLKNRRLKIDQPSTVETWSRQAARISLSDFRCLTCRHRGPQRQYRAVFLIALKLPSTWDSRPTGALSGKDHCRPETRC